MSNEHTVSVQGRQLTFSNLDKIFYPKTGFTKRDVIAYYNAVAPVLLPHLQQRAITLKRYPDGVEGNFFYEKRCPAHAPRWLKTTAVEKKDGSTIRYCLIGDLPSLLWAANMANLELHPFLHRATAPSRPTCLMFDLDPGPPAGLQKCCRVALWLRDLFLALGLQSFPKTSGSKGLQLVVPLNTPVTYRRTKAFAQAVAEALSQRFPQEVVAEMKKEMRTGKVFIDWSQNDDAKTTVAPYSLRAGAQATASTPVAWEELESALRRGKADSLRFTATDLLQRIEKRGDLHAPVLTLKQKLPSVLHLPV